jgi:hypothetical protein
MVVEAQLRLSLGGGDVSVPARGDYSAKNKSWRIAASGGPPRLWTLSKTPVEF